MLIFTRRSYYLILFILLGTAPLIAQPVTLNLKVFLEGPFDQGLGNMEGDFLQRGVLPQGQPYTGSPWNYTGTEGNGWLPTDYPVGTLDWVLVSLRESLYPESEVTRVAAVLLEDGNLSPFDVNLNTTKPLYVMVEHRNHLPIISAQPIPIVNNTISYDFTTQNSYQGSGFGQKQVGTNWMMYGGNAEQADLNSCDINIGDKVLWETFNGLFGVYNPGDYNLDADVNAMDRIVFNSNNGIFTTIAKRQDKECPPFQGLLDRPAATDGTDFSTPPLPALNTPVADINGFNVETTIVANGGLRHRYSSFPAWNANGTMLWLNQAGNKILRCPEQPGDGWQDTGYNSPISQDWPQWHRTKPTVMVAAQGNELIEVDLVTGSSNVIATFAGYTDVRMIVRTTASYDGKKYGVLATKANGDQYAIAVNTATGMYSTPVSFDSLGFDANNRRRVGVTASGKYIVIAGQFAPNRLYNTEQFYNWNGTPHSVQLNPNINSAGIANECTSGHGDFGLDANGKDIFVGQCDGGDGPLSAQFGQSTIAYRIDDGLMYQVSPQRFAHVSAQNHNKPGFAYASGWGPYRPTIVELDLTYNGGPTTPMHIAPVYNMNYNPSQYIKETHAVPNHNATKLVYTSDWNDNLNAGSAVVVNAR